MRIPALILFLHGLGFEIVAADASATPASLLRVGPLKLREFPAEALYIQPIQTSFELSAESLAKKFESDLSRFKAMNGRDVLDLPPKLTPPARAQRLLNFMLPKDGNVFAKNPNAPPGSFTR